MVGAAARVVEFVEPADEVLSLPYLLDVLLLGHAVIVYLHLVLIVAFVVGSEVRSLFFRWLHDLVVAEVAHLWLRHDHLGRTVVRAARRLLALLASLGQVLLMSDHLNFIVVIFSCIVVTNVAVAKFPTMSPPADRIWRLWTRLELRKDWVVMARRLASRVAAVRILRALP